MTATCFLVTSAGALTNLGTNVLYSSVVVMIFFRVLQTIFFTLFFGVGLPAPQECAFSSF